MRTNIVKVYLVATLIGVPNVLPLAFGEQEGVIEFSDRAPPTTDKDKQEALAWSERANQISGLLERLASVLRATEDLRKSISQTTVLRPDGIVAITQYREIWSAAVEKLFQRSAGPVQVSKPGTYLRITPPQSFLSTAVPPMAYRWSIDDAAITAYVPATLKLAQALKSGGALPDATQPFDNVSLLAEVTLALKQQSFWFDELVAEHGILNGNLRYYPYSSLASQAPVSCNLINAHSVNFKCVSVSAGDQLTDPKWLFSTTVKMADYCVANNAQPYSVEEWTSMKTLVHRSALDPVSVEGLIDSQVDQPRSSKALGAKC